MGTSVQEVTRLEMEFEDGRDKADTVTIEYNPKSVGNLIKLALDDGDTYLSVVLDDDEFEEMQRGVNKVGRELGTHGEEALDLEKVFSFIQSKGLDICDNVGPVHPERLSELIEEWTNASKPTEPEV